MVLLSINLPVLRAYVHSPRYPSIKPAWYTRLGRVKEIYRVGYALARSSYYKPRVTERLKTGPWAIYHGSSAAIRFNIGS